MTRFNDYEIQVFLPKKGSSIRFIFALMFNQTDYTSKISLLGGIGPWAGLLVHKNTLALSNRAVEKECVSIIHLSYPCNYSDRIEFILGKITTNPANELGKINRKELIKMLKSEPKAI